jgi:hypothetical protein
LVPVAEQSLSEPVVGAPIDTQDANQSLKDWRLGYQDYGNELSIHLALFAG